jgi:dTDP-4-dehydrorhamnose 3,5-epimerase
VASAIPGVFVLAPVVAHDDRGFFSRTLTPESLERTGVGVDQFRQHSQSRSLGGVLRGVHVRIEPGEEKLIRCSSGRVFDVLVDLRPDSNKFGRWESFILDDVEQRALLVPAGVGHGFQVLSDIADLIYLHTTLHSEGTDLTIRWDDPDLAINWPQTPRILSKRDAEAPRLAELQPRLERWKAREQPAGRR